MAGISPYFRYKRYGDGNCYPEVNLRGPALLRLAATNKGTAFTEKERRELGLEGALPPQVVTLEQQVARAYRTFIREPDDIAKYQFLRATQVLSTALLDGSASRTDLDGEDLGMISDFVRSRVWHPRYLPTVAAENAL